MQKVTNYLSKYNSTEFVETEEIKFGAFHRFIHVGNYALITDIYQKHFENVHLVDGLSLLRQGFHIYDISEVHSELHDKDRLTKESIKSERTCNGPSNYFMSHIITVCDNRFKVPRPNSSYLLISLDLILL